MLKINLQTLSIQPFQDSLSEIRVSFKLIFILFINWRVSLLKIFK